MGFRCWNLVSWVRSNSFSKIRISLLIYWNKSISISIILTNSWQMYSIKKVTPLYSAIFNKGILKWIVIFFLSRLKIHRVSNSYCKNLFRSYSTYSLINSILDYPFLPSHKAYWISILLLKTILRRRLVTFFFSIKLVN
jgi:hypothetical protein